MEKKSKVLVSIFIILIIISIIITYYRTMVVRDFYVEGEPAPVDEISG
jgi:hypothetical protein